MREVNLISKIDIGALQVTVVPHNVVDHHAIIAAKLDARGDMASQSDKWGCRSYIRSYGFLNYDTLYALLIRLNIRLAALPGYSTVGCRGSVNTTRVLILQVSTLDS